MNPTRALTRPRGPAAERSYNRPFEKAPRKRRIKTPFAHASQVTRLFGRVSYYHPTKGWRFRRPTMPLVLGLAAATV